MKPSERIQELCKEILGRQGQAQPRPHQLAEALPQAIVEYLDEKAAEVGPTIVPTAEP